MVNQSICDISNSTDAIASKKNLPDLFHYYTVVVDVKVAPAPHECLLFHFIIKSIRFFTGGKSLHHEAEAAAQNQESRKQKTTKMRIL